MAFTHGKNARLWIDQYELTSYFSEFTMGSKAGVADTTVFGKGAKSYISGLKEGTISAKGFFDPGASANDQELSNALGRATNMNVSMSPNGVVSAGSRAIVAFAAETDYSITNPVDNVVGVSFSAQADSGLSTGVFLYDPTAAAKTTAATFGAAAPVLWVSTALPALGAAAVTIVTATGANLFHSAGTFIAAGGTVTTPGVYAYTGTTATTFTGVTCLIPAAGTANASTSITQGLQDSVAATSQNGLVCNFHLLNYTYTGTPTTITPKLQHSADGITFVDLIGGGGAYTFATPSGSTHTGAFDNTSNASGTGGAIVGLVPANVTINQFLRLVVITTLTTTLSTTFFATAARQ